MKIPDEFPWVNVTLLAGTLALGLVTFALLWFG